jgi:quercetin dioxygenase-like cupin family protein
MEISPAADSTFDHGNGRRFIGEVSLRGTHRASDGTNIAVVHFAAGARTHWHHHEGGQFLFALTGRGRVRSRGEVGHVLEPGDVISVEPNEWHFHGGTPDSPLVHVAVNGGGDAIWGEPVTDEEYAEGF